MLRISPVKCISTVTRLKNGFKQAIKPVSNSIYSMSSPYIANFEKYNGVSVQPSKRLYVAEQNPVFQQVRFYSKDIGLVETIQNIPELPDPLKLVLIDKVDQPFSPTNPKGISHGGRSVEKHSCLKNVIFDREHILSEMKGKTDTEKFNNYAKKIIEEILNAPNSQNRIRFNAPTRGGYSTMLEIGIPKKIGSRFDIEISETALFEIQIVRTDDYPKIDVIRFRGFIANFKPADDGE